MNLGKHFNVAQGKATISIRGRANLMRLFIWLLFIVVCESAIGTAFDFFGAIQTYTVPLGVRSILVKIWGAGGGGTTTSNSCGNYGGGAGGYTQCYVTVQPLEVLYVIVGGGGSAGKPCSVVSGGYGGGGSGMIPVGVEGCSGWAIGGGGGRSSIQRNVSGSFYDIVTAGGGGGGGGVQCGWNSSSTYNNGGGGGGVSGASSLGIAGGQGGSQTSGGTGPSNLYGWGDSGAGSQYKGGVAVSGGSQGQNYGAGGGSGYWGGASGGSVNGAVGGGGGGSGYIGGCSSYGHSFTLAGSSGLTNGRASPMYATDSVYVSDVGLGGAGGESDSSGSGGNGFVYILPAPTCAFFNDSMGLHGIEQITSCKECLNACSSNVDCWYYSWDGNAPVFFSVDICSERLAGAVKSWSSSGDCPLLQKYISNTAHSLRGSLAYMTYFSFCSRDIYIQTVSFLTGSDWSLYTCDSPVVDEIVNSTYPDPASNYSLLNPAYCQMDSGSSSDNCAAVYSSWLESGICPKLFQYFAEVIVNIGQSIDSLSSETLFRQQMASQLGSAWVPCSNNLIVNELFTCVYDIYAGFVSVTEDVISVTGLSESTVAAGSNIAIFWTCPSSLTGNLSITLCGTTRQSTECVYTSAQYGVLALALADTFTIPSDTSAGTYYFQLNLDFGSPFYSDFFSVTQAGKFSITGLSEYIVGAGSNITVFWTNPNSLTGTLVITLCEYEWHWYSTVDTTACVNTAVHHGIPVAALAYTFTIPSSTSTGYYYLLFESETDSTIPGYASEYFNVASGISCYIGPADTYFFPYISFADYSCVKYCFQCTPGDTGCTASQISSSAVVPGYTVVPTATAALMTDPAYAIYYIDAAACNTTNCNAPPLSCAAPPDSIKSRDEQIELALQSIALKIRKLQADHFKSRQKLHWIRNQISDLEVLVKESGSTIYLSELDDLKRMVWQLGGKGKKALHLHPVSLKNVTTLQVAWECGDMKNKRVKIELFSGDSFLQTLTPSIPCSKKLFSTTLSSSLKPGRKFRVKILDPSNSKRQDFSASFQIKAGFAVNKPSISSTGIVSVAWTYIGLKSPYVAISLLQNGQVVDTIASMVKASSKTFSGVLSGPLPPSTDYIVAVADLLDPSIIGFSPAFYIPDLFEVLAEPSLK